MGPMKKDVQNWEDGLKNANDWEAELKGELRHHVKNWEDELRNT